MTGPLAGRTAVVTGAGQGVGQGIAAALATAGRERRARGAARRDGGAGRSRDP